MKTFIALLFYGLIILSSCSENSPKQITGVYNGTFHVQYADQQAFSNPVNITFQGDKFVCSSGTNRMPAGGSGSFSIYGDSIKFTDGNFWTADFDWNLILNGTYAIKDTDSKLVIVKGKEDGNIYRYELKKQ